MATTATEVIFFGRHGAKKTARTAGVRAVSEIDRMEAYGNTTASIR